MSKNFNQYGKEEKKTGSVYLVLLWIALIVIIWTYGFYVPALKNHSWLGDKYSLLNPGVKLTDKEDRLVNFQDLRKKLRDQYESRDDYLITLYFEYLPTGANISINKNEKIWPASLLKVPVAMAVMKKIQDGTWKLTDELSVTQQSKDSGYGTLYKQPIGTRFSIEKLLEESLVNSDNTAHRIFAENLEISEIKEVYIHLGLDDVLHDLETLPLVKGDLDTRITAKRYSIFFRSLYNATFLDVEHSQKFLEFLRESPKEYLSAGLASDTEFLHKTAIKIEDQVYADSGIIYIPDRPYILTVMLQKKTGQPIVEDKEAKKFFKEISKEIYSYVVQAKN